MQERASRQAVIASIRSRRKAWQFIMADSNKKRKAVKQAKNPPGRSFGTADPDSSIKKHLSWSFSLCDIDPSIRWSFCKARLSDTFWDVIIPKMREFESMTLAEIFVQAKKQHHRIDVTKLAPEAVARLTELHIEAEAVHSLRLGGQLRLYGILDGSTYSIIWYDEDHGNNKTCVCRSNLHHT